MSRNALRTQARLIPSIEGRRREIVRQLKLDVISGADHDVQSKLIARSFISDTITVPTKEMYAYAVQASLGDDVHSADQSTNALEGHIAQLAGKDAALFIPSGTMSNQLAIRTHLKQPPYSVLADHRSHIWRHEVGGSAVLSGATLVPIVPTNGHHLTLPDVQASAIMDTDIHYAPTELVTLENTLNGTIMPQSEIIAMSNFVHSHGIKLHLDGARIWDVAAETGRPLEELCAPFDSVSLCFSKGLGAPVGSCLIGEREFIARARRLRKLFGGGMRQTGILAGCVAYALSNNFALLPAVHSRARYLERRLEEIGVKILSRAETCMFLYDPSPLGLTYEKIADRANQLPEPLTLSGSRVVLHIQTTQQAVEDFISVVQELAAERKKAGLVGGEVKFFE